MIHYNVINPDITVTLDADGVIQKTILSEAFAGEQLEEWQGRPWGETIDPAIARDVSELIENVRRSGATSCFNVKQKFPSGLELQMEYTTISLGKRAGFVAVGRNIQTISDLQSRLLIAQQAREKDYWKHREIETRYRVLFEVTNESVLSVNASNMRIVEANQAATKALGLFPGGEFLPDLQPRDQKSLHAMLDAVRAHGRAPSIALHLGSSHALWTLRAILMSTEAGAFYLFQLAAVGAVTRARESSGPFSVDNLVRRLPDGFVVMDRAGIIRFANDAFLDLAQTSIENAVVGQKLNRWLSQPGADVEALFGLIHQHGAVKMLTTHLHGELGLTTEVEVSAAGDQDKGSNYFAIIVRDVTMRLGEGLFPGSSPSRSNSEETATQTLEQIVRESTEAIERRNIALALQQSEGNRTIAARRLGLSRQSLHTKLNKYSFD
jgi:transcriptional regulator PpsR